MLLSHPETLSRLNARRMKGMDKANPILTVISLVSELFMQGMARNCDERHTNILEHVVYRKLSVTVQGVCVDVDCEECSHEQYGLLLLVSFEALFHESGVMGAHKNNGHHSQDHNDLAYPG
jgi:hypothetical protein